MKNKLNKTITLLCSAVLFFLMLGKNTSRLNAEQENFNLIGHWIEKGKNVYNIMFNPDKSYEIIRADKTVTQGTYKIDGKVITMEFESKGRKVKSVYSILKRDKNKFTAKVVTMLVSTGQVVQDENVVVSRVFIDNGNGTIIDTRTGLMWQQDGLASGKLYWQSAMDDCKKLRLAGFSYWRLPTIDELKVLLNITVGDRKTESERNRAEYLNNNGFKNVLSYYYWSASTYADNANKAWCVELLFGSVYYYYKTDGYFVLAVRSGQ